MKITAIEAIPVQATFDEVYWGNQSWGRNKADDSNAPGLPSGDDRSQYPYFWRSRAAYSRTVDTTIVKISTDSGIIGRGEAKSPVAPTITATIIRDLASGLLIGEDPTDPLLHWGRLDGAMRIRGGSHGFWMPIASDQIFNRWQAAWM